MKNRSAAIYTLLYKAKLLIRCFLSYFAVWLKMTSSTFDMFCFIGWHSESGKTLRYRIRSIYSLLSLDCQNFHHNILTIRTLFLFNYNKICPTIAHHVLLFLSPSFIVLTNYQFIMAVTPNHTCILRKRFRLMPHSYHSALLLCRTGAAGPYYFALL